MPKNRVLIIDDEEGIRFGIRRFLQSEGYEVLEADSCRVAQEVFQNAKPDVVIIDYKLPDGDALTLLPIFKKIDSEIPLIILTAHGSIDLAVRAIKEGAEQFFTKPIELPTLLVILNRVLENQRNRRKNIVDNTKQARKELEPFLGTSGAIQELAELAYRVLQAERPVLICGETGVGKGVLAKWLHSNGNRKDEVFLDLNCAGLSHELLETELFGHQKGAFTSATTNKIGLFEIAHRGTVFLDEIGDMDIQIQPKLLKVLEEQKFRRIGDVYDRQVDIRLIAATNQELNQLVKEKRFRNDLLFRINTISINIPPLRQRVEDIPVIANKLVKHISSQLGRCSVELSQDSLKALKSYSWPGNIRELKNTLERAVLLSESNIIRAKDLQLNNLLSTSIDIDDLNMTLAQYEQLYIKKVLESENGNIERSAKRLGISRSSLYQKIKNLNYPLS
ncbi:MAG: sigma-54-dependent Fis family transcriptional regulator [Acidobacteria bacterium]|nr:sigma-54-dependent Fis family transcriptional regulator [Acidobacteriota bacterium]